MAVLESPPVVYGERLLAAAAHLRLCCYELHTPTELPHFDPAAIGSFFENFGRSRRRLAIVEALDHLRSQRDMPSRIEEIASVGVHSRSPGHLFRGIVHPFVSPRRYASAHAPKENVDNGGPCAPCRCHRPQNFSRRGRLRVA